MEWLESLLPLIIFAIYFLSRLGKSRREAEQPPPEARLDASAPRAATPFEELIRQIQQAAEEAKQTAEQSAAKTPATRTVTPVRPKEAAAPPALPAPARLEEGRSLEGQSLESRGPEFHEVGAFEHERHGFGPDNPFSEESFSHLARGTDVTAHAPGHLGHDPHGLSTPSAPARRHPLAERLRHPGTARDALVIRTLLDPPRARRPRGGAAQ